MRNSSGMHICSGDLNSCTKFISELSLSAFFSFKRGQVQTLKIRK